ncbi:MAG: hypothetical protein C0622_01640 [Desulfuromonas sp.]|nr:MAG: hypothetical protein C0622_01640 [Desulfuromonas sp.]
MKTLLVFLALSLPFQALAELPTQIVSDFSLTNGTIIMPVDDGYLLDLDDSVSLQEGDILALYGPAESETLTALESGAEPQGQPRGFLQVTSVKSGYSYARMIGTSIEPLPGDRVVRYSKVPAVYQSAATDAALGKELQAELTTLHWLAPGSAQSAELTFVLDEKKLLVRDSTGDVIKSYQYANGRISAPYSAAYQQERFGQGGEKGQIRTALNETVNNLLGSVGLSDRDRRLEAPGIILRRQQESDIWIGPRMEGNPVGVAIGDFDKDGQQETAVAMEDELLVQRLVDGELKTVATVDFKGLQLLNLETADLDGNGSPELYISAYSAKDVRSVMVEFVDGAYQKIISNNSWFFRTIDLLDEGKVLAGQILGPIDAPMAATSFRVGRSGDQLIRGESLPLPGAATLFSVLPFIGLNNDLLYATINFNDKLGVYSPGGNQLWQSVDFYGGSEVFFFPADDTQRELVKPVMVQQRILRLSPDEMLVVKNKGLRAFERYRSYNEGSVVAMEWDGFGLAENWQTVPQGGYIADIALGDIDNDGEQELIEVVMYSRDNFMQKGRSSIVIYELLH